MATDEERQGFLKAIAEAPNDRATRLGYADWLGEQQQDVEACFQRYMADQPPEVKETLIVFRKRGGLVESRAGWDQLEQVEREAVRERVEENFDDHAYVEFIVVSDLSLTECGFRQADRSPILHWERPTGRVRDVVPASFSKQQEEDLIAHPRANGKGGGPPAQGRAFGELARPH